MGRDVGIISLEMRTATVEGGGESMTDGQNPTGDTQASVPKEKKNNRRN